MKRILIKTILIAITLIVGLILVGAMQLGQLGTIPMWISAVGMFAVVGTIWRY